MYFRPDEAKLGEIGPVHQAIYHAITFMFLAFYGPKLVIGITMGL